MASMLGEETKDESLNDSWVEFHFPTRTPPSEDLSFMKPIIVNSSMEKLLLEAQKEGSRGSSRTASSRGSPRSPHSPNNESVPINVTDISSLQERQEFNQGAPIPTDWIWDWSSRPEAVPRSEFMGRFKHPQRHKLSVRNTRVMRGGPFCLENLPVLLLSHACTFFLGAAAMLIYLKKYCNWTAITAVAAAAD